MKKLFLIFLITFAVPTIALAFYDFCESPQDYNTFPAAYDLNTEYWKDIPNYNQKGKIKFKKEDKKKQSKEDSKQNEIQK